MLAVILCWTLITIVSYSFGRLFLILTKQLTKENLSYSFFDTFFIGLSVVGSITCITSLFFPSGIIVAGVFMAISVLYLLFDCKYLKKYALNIGVKYRRMSRFQILLILFFALIFSSYAILPPQWPDTFYYHIQNVMWNEEYRVVPGLANLIEQFGFNSNFFLLSSVFALKPLFGQCVYGVNALCLFILFIYVVSLASQQINRLLVLFAIVLIGSLFFIYKNHIGSLSTDILPNLLIVYLLINILTNPQNIHEKRVLFWLLPVYCVTLKLSSVFACLVIFYIAWYLLKEKDTKKIVYILICSFIIILPWLVRNIMITGYVIYPFPAIDLFSFDWKIPIEYVVESKGYVEAYAITEKAMNRPNEEVFAWPFMYKLSLWIKEKSLFENAVTLLAIISALFTTIALLVSKKLKSKENAPLVIFWLVNLAGFLFWLLMAPDVRFGMAFILSVISIPIYLLLKDSVFEGKASVPVMKSLFVLICLIAFILSVRYFISVKDPGKPLHSILIVPENLANTFDNHFQQISVQRINNLEFHKPKTSCLDCELPCSPRPVDNIEMRGVSLQDGFRQKKN